MRLLLACLVIVGHAPEIIDGDRHREPLSMLFHTLSLGGCAVDGFFLLSGYLITQSMLRTQAIVPFLANRVARIYPAFIVCYVLCVVMAPLVGGQVSHHLPATAANLLLLKPPPDYPGLLAGLHYPALNGAAWTIEYEFRCYLLVAVLWAVGLLRRRWLVLGLTAVALLLSVASGLPGFPPSFNRWAPHADSLIGTPVQDAKLVAIYLLGVTACLFETEFFRILRWPVALLAVGVLGLLLPVKPVADVAFGLFGGLGLFWLSFRAGIGPLQRINDRWDISYGAYLYGWPIAAMLFYFRRDLGPWELAALSLVGALAMGWLSWTLVESWSKGLFKTRWPRTARPAGALAPADAA